MTVFSKIRDFITSKFYHLFFYSEALLFIAIGALVVLVVIGR